MTGKIGAKTQQSRRGHGPSFTRAALGERMARQCENVQQFHPLQFMIHLGVSESSVRYHLDEVEMPNTLAPSCMPSTLSPSRKQTDSERNKNRRPTATHYTTHRRQNDTYMPLRRRRHRPQAAPHARPHSAASASIEGLLLLLSLPLGSSAFLSSSHK